ncbi:murein transglycosylase A [Anianabacter salinae]|uniref:murein transglycosylase A n=1 Tax=Anianabacter salinae TaxID=2851023 RepID=UPI00225E3218|nr:murein transglycosylase A [Anianabacter salinae]MBV0913505.1 murein transglycosylase A [Anianabacter salinae]
MKRLAAALGLFLAGAFMTGPAAAEATYSILQFSELEGWEDDDHAAAIPAFLETCRDLDDPDWRPLCAMAAEQENAKAFFELFFRPVLISDGDPCLFTGYFEPELKGSRNRTATFRYPIYRVPPDVNAFRPWHTREDIEKAGVLRGRGLELAWVDDPVELFFLQIQGSGRIRFSDGSVMRVGYGANNGHPYRSVGQELVRRGIYAAHQVSAQVIQNWVRRNPRDGTDLLHSNPSFVFFREVTQVPSDKGPLGAMNRSITPLRTVAVDPAYTPLGAPVWIEKGGEGPMRRLMIAQDTGSAIKGAQRADIFFGTGTAAGRLAGKIRDPGRMIVLLPIQRAYALATEDTG